MLIAHGIGRLGLLAVGLGIGAAMASTPGVASADDIQISIDGIDLFPTAGNTATATSGFGDMAIAIGDGATAQAEGGFGDFASADGTGAEASGYGDFDVASAVGTDSGAFAEPYYTAGGNFDFASAFGTDTLAYATDGNGNVASVFDPTATSGSLPGGVSSESFAGFGNGDIASVFGNGDTATAGDGAIPSSGDMGNLDIAEVFGTGSTADAGANFTDPGSYDFAAAFGESLTALAQGANFLFDLMP
jgi:hypothetical protein